MKGGDLRRLMILVAGLLAAGALVASPAGAQEAPICVKVQKKLDDDRNNWIGANHGDSVSGLRGKDHLYGRHGADLLNGGRDNDVVEGGQGDDVLCGGRSADKLYGGPGDDIIYGEEENDTVFPGAGDDKVLGSAGDDRILGWGMEDGAYTEDGIDILNGGHHDDVLQAGGADLLYGHNHSDLLFTRTPEIAPRVMDGEGNNDTIIGSDLADTLIGGEGRDRVFGSLGDDLILGAGNDDRLFGEGGDDRLNAGKGFDFLDGGSGGDVCDGGAHDLPDDKFDPSCERVENRPRLKRGERRVKSRIKLTALRTSGAKGKVTSASTGCEGADRKIRLQRYEGFITGLVATTKTNDRGRWTIRRSLRSGRYFAQVDGGSGCRYDVSRNRRL